jgi:cytochrome c oxidase subunit I
MSRAMNIATGVATTSAVADNGALYELPVVDDLRRPLAAAWLLFGIAALLLSGLFVLLILLSRTPGVEALFPYKDFFHHAIVVHVDFSVLVWFSAIGAMFWTLAAQPRAAAVAWAALAVVVVGSLLIAVAAFMGGAALMSNYIPVIDNRTFLSGLTVIGAGVVLMALRCLLYPDAPGAVLRPGGVLRFGIHTSMVALLLSAGALVWSWAVLPDFLTGMQYYEVLFWGSGHLLQFAWTQLMLVAWLWLAGVSGVRMPLSPRLVMLLLLAGVAPAFLGVWGYLAWEVGSPQQRTFFIWLMAAGGGLAAGPIGLALLVGWWRSPKAVDTRSRGLRAALLLSILLFGIGGALGFMIDSSNTIVPAHYHGCIVAVTLAFMALGLHLLPRFGFAEARARWVLWMPLVYGVGQILHVAGLAFSGGHGVQRKTAGAAQGLEGIAQVAGMAVMGLGGLIAVIGGVLFLIAVTGCLRRRGALGPATSPRPADT